MGPKGGSGKTPTAAAVALSLAELRGEITAVLDGNTHLGTLRRRLVEEGVNPPQPMLAMAELARAGQLAPEWPVLARYCDMVGRLRVFSNSGVDPRLVEDMTGQQYAVFLQLLSRAAQLVVSDMGTSAAGDVAIAALDAADQLVVCTEMRRDALELALEWIAALAGSPVSYRPDPEDYSSIADGRYAELVRRAIVVVAPGGGDPIELRPILDWMATVTTLGSDRGRVVVVPHDAHIATGGQISLAQLQPATRMAYLQVAAHAVANFQLPPLAWGGPRAVPLPARSASVGDPDGPAARALTMPAAYQPPTASFAHRSTVRPTAAATPTSTAAVPGVATEDRPAQVQVADSANFALGRELGRVLGVSHTCGEVCCGCTDPQCSWPTPPPGVEP